MMMAADLLLRDRSFHFHLGWSTLTCCAIDPAKQLFLKIFFRWFQSIVIRPEFPVGSSRLCGSFVDFLKMIICLFHCCSNKKIKFFVVTSMAFTFIVKTMKLDNRTCAPGPLLSIVRTSDMRTKMPSRQVEIYFCSFFPQILFLLHLICIFVSFHLGDRFNRLLEICKHWLGPSVSSHLFGFLV